MRICQLFGIKNKRIGCSRCAYIEKVANLDNSVLSPKGGLTDSQLATTYSLSDLFAFVKQYDKEFHPKPVSKHLVRDGERIQLYHQTENESGGRSLTQIVQWSKSQRTGKKEC